MNTKLEDITDASQDRIRALLEPAGDAGHVALHISNLLTGVCALTVGLEKEDRERIGLMVSRELAMLSQHLPHDPRLIKHLVQQIDAIKEDVSTALETDQAQVAAVMIDRIRQG